MGQTAYDSTMTVRGTIQKTFGLFILLLISGGISWNLTASGSPLAFPLLIAGFAAAIIGGLIGVFSPKTSRITAPIYALGEGLILGGISFAFNQQIQGIVFQAIILTLGVLLVMIGLYSGRVIRATATFVKVVTVATIAVCMTYLVSFALSFFGTTIPYIHESGTIGIAFSGAVVVLAALNFVLDFDMIEKGEQHGAPRYMEWYGALSIMITLVWLYINILRLLSKLSSRD